MSEFTLYIVRRDDEVALFPARPALEKALSYREKAMVVEGWQRKTQFTTESLILRREPHPQAPHLEILYADQGLWYRAWQCAMKHGWNVQLIDERIPLQAPNLAAMHGFRFNQREKLTEFLLADQSGMLDAPTRYGKSYLVLNTLRAYEGVKTGILIPGKDLGDQTYQFLQKNLGRHREVRMIGFGSKHQIPSEDVTIYSMSSLEKADFSTRLLLIDEVHAMGPEARMEQLRKFKIARRLGFGATTSGRYDNRDVVVEAAIGPVLTSISYREARDIGAVDHLVVFAVNWPYVVRGSRDWVYKNELFESKRVALFLQRLFSEVIPNDWQTIAFIETEASADYYVQELGGDNLPAVAMAKKFKPKERLEFLQKMKEGNITRCFASRIYSQGVTFSDLRVVINIAGGGPNTYAVQKPGRVLEVRPGKKCGVLIDFILRGAGSGKGNAWGPHKEAESRLKLYHDKGYEVLVVNDLDQLKTLFQAKCL